MTLVGRHIGRYRILEELGSGGMSVVYKGLDTALGREVAVKVLHPHLSGRDESRRRLAREARAVAKLQHPNIIEIFDFSAADTGDDAFIVTEYIRGRTLRQYLEQQPFHPPELAAMVVHELAAALAHAHESGVIHRDLKPENVMIREDGALKLMDFGIAKIVDRDERMTMTGALVGSPAHMAPEIIEGEEAGPEADIFSLGTLLYVSMTGRLPFSAPNTTATLKKILDGAYEDPRQVAPAVSDELAEICARCLARRPEDRYPHAGKLRDALGDYLAALGLGRVNEELASFFADPPSYQQILQPRIVQSLLERAERHVRKRRVPRALASLNQALTLAPDDARAQAMVQRIHRSGRRARLARKGLAASLTAALLALLVASWRLAGGGPEPLAQPATAPAPLGTPEPAPAAPAPSPPEALPPSRPADPPAVARGQGAPSAPRVQTVRAAPVPISVLVRPYGVVRLDDGPPTAQPLPQHELLALPGRHRVVVSCAYCDDAVETIEVRAGGENVFRLRAQLKPSPLSFDYAPEDAEVRIGDVLRSARESLERPFEIRSPRGPSSFQHRVEYEIRSPGFRTERRVVMLEPGKATTLRGALERE